MSGMSGALGDVRSFDRVTERGVSSLIAHGLSKTAMLVEAAEAKPGKRGPYRKGISNCPTTR